jgi:hypothetical protein
MGANIHPFGPAEAGTQDWFATQLQLWIPACAGMSGV